jgi:hypothetical protein
MSYNSTDISRQCAYSALAGSECNDNRDVVVLLAKLSVAVVHSDDSASPLSLHTTLPGLMCCIKAALDIMLCT